MTAMNLGRNDPCHCGSGKKYKKCCLAKDEEAKRAEQAKPIAPAAPAAAPPAKPRDLPKPPPDPRMEAWNARWEEFEAADYEGQLDLFARTLDDPELMDGEMAFEMLSHLFPETVKHSERDRFDALVESLRERRPEVYAKEAHYCLDWQITNALVAGRDDRVPALARELAPLAGKQIDSWNRTEEMLAYHSQLPALVEAARLAWPEVRSATDIVPWGVNEFSERGIDYELFDYVTHAPVPDSGDAALLARLKFFGKINRARLADYLAHLTGQADRPWAMSDFEFADPHSRSQANRDEEPEEDWDEESEANEEAVADGVDEVEEEEEEEKAEADEPPTGERNLYDLSVEFLGYLHRVEGVPYTKGELGRRELVQFIQERHAGKLEYEESMLQAMQRNLDRQQGRRPPPKPKFRRFEHKLVPDRERLDRFLAGLLGFLNQLYYRAAATFEIVPAWLRFLESRGLIAAAERASALRDLEGLAEALLKVFNNYTDDPTPRQALERWREAAKPEPPR